ncbi:MAG: hypothetical protein SFX18_03720 [Pirellulales bacterium]|nr:hypothetical protein [Pirellulales bacterium]
MPAGSLIASDQRPLGLLLRPDLRWQALPARGGDVWQMVYDPISERHWILRGEEAHLCQLLQPEASVRDLQRAWERRFAPQKLTAEALIPWLGQLAQEGLVSSTKSGFVSELLRQRSEPAPTERGPWWQNILAWRGPGFDPTPWLQPLAGWGRAFATSTMLAGLLGCLILASMALWKNWEAAVIDSQRLTILLPLMSWGGWLALLAAVKGLHEAGHALVATGLGYPPRRCGVLLLLGVPTLYCQVNHLWRAPRGTRLWVNGAGILVELWLVGGGILLWSALTPGLMRDLAWQVALLAGVNTLFLNGNPLLRYDGYYLLADSLNLPNLREQAASVTWHAARGFLGYAPDLRGRAWWHAHAWPGRMLLILYSLASAVYRWTLAWGMVWLVGQYLAPRGIRSVAWLLGGLFLVLFLGPPLQMIAKLAASEQASPAAQRQRARWRLAILAGLLAGILLIPWPVRIYTTVYVETAAAQPVVTSVAGKLLYSATPGERVTAGQILAKLDNPELRQSVERLAGELRQLQQRADVLKRQPHDPQATAQLPAIETALREKASALRQAQTEQERLTIKADQAGVLVPPRGTWPKNLGLSSSGVPRAAPTDHSLEWQGLPLDQQNLGAWLRAGTDLGAVVAVSADDQRIKAELWGLIAESEVPLVQPGQAVQVMLAADPGKIFLGTVAEISHNPTRDPPPELVRRERAKFQTDVPSLAANEPFRNSLAQPLIPHYYVRIELDAPAGELVYGQTGEARMNVGWQSLAERTRRWLVRLWRG